MTRMLTDEQVRLASIICVALDGVSDADALAALNSIVACTLVERSADSGTAIGRATAFGLQLEKTVQAGLQRLRGELMRDAHAPIDLRMVL